MARITQEILDKIKEEIKNKKGLNQRKVAKKIGVSPSEFSKILNDDRPFKVNHLIEIAEVLDVKIEDLFANPERIDIERMPMLYMIRIICKQEFDKHCTYANGKCIKNK